jgi:hypothetical protein
MSVINFRCGFGSNGEESSLCFNGGSCLNQTNVEYLIFGEKCDCPVGYMHDLTSGHFYNCTLPSNFLLILFIILSGLTMATFLILFRKLKQAKSTVKKVGIIYLILTMTDWLIVLSLYIENGRFYGANVFSVIRNITAAIFFVELILVLYGALLARFKQQTNRIRQIAYRRCFAYFAVDLATHLAMLVTASEPNPVRYNTIFAFYLFYTSVGFASIGLIFSIKSNSLQRMVKKMIIAPEPENGTKKELKKFLYRLNGVRDIPFICAVGTSILVPALLLVTIGSIPYSFAWVMTLHSHMVLISPFFLKFLGTQGKKQAPEFESRANNLIIHENS